MQYRLRTLLILLLVFLPFVCRADGSRAVDPTGRPDEKTVERYKRLKGTKNGMRHATTVGLNELDFDFWWHWGSHTAKCSYELKDGQLRIILGGNNGRRPTDFDEAHKDPTLTYYALKKMK